MGRFGIYMGLRSLCAGGSNLQPVMPSQAEHAANHPTGGHAHWQPAQDPAQAALNAPPVGARRAAADEPTQLGRAAESGIGFGSPEPGLRPPELSREPRRSQPPNPTAGTPGSSDSPPPASSGGAYVTVVATHVEPPPGASTLPFIQDPDSPVAASFRVLRHRLREAQSPRTIAVTSPGPKEGKTSSAINLAMAFAEHGREKVLLVEANMRSPNLGATLGFVAPCCFGRQMAAHLKSPLAPWQVVATFFHNLHVLAIDPASTGEWRMSAPALKLAMDQLQGSAYSHIVVDCPSALGSADVNVIEDTTDGVLLTAIAGRTTADSLKRAVRHLAPANIIGVVMLGA
jgi:Mrp family chromosome partitioning ATPase